MLTLESGATAHCTCSPLLLCPLPNPASHPLPPTRALNSDPHNYGCFHLFLLRLGGASSPFPSFQGCDFFLGVGKFQGCRRGLHFPTPVSFFEVSVLFFMESWSGDILLLPFIDFCHIIPPSFPPFLKLLLGSGLALGSRVTETILGYLEEEIRKLAIAG